MDKFYTSGPSVNAHICKETGFPIFISIMSRRAYDHLRIMSILSKWPRAITFLDPPFFVGGHKIKAFCPDTGAFIATKQEN